jgi:hypothetical protein
MIGGKLQMDMGIDQTRQQHPLTSYHPRSCIPGLKGRGRAHREDPAIGNGDRALPKHRRADRYHPGSQIQGDGRNRIHVLTDF